MIKQLRSSVSLLASVAATWLRAGFGGVLHSKAQAADRPLELYDMEGCPFCRLTREAISELGLSVRVLPAPKNGQRYRPQAVERGGKAQFPYLRDPNTGIEMYESMATVQYLFEQYAQGVPLRWKLGPLHKLESSVVSALRPGIGHRLHPSQPGDEDIHLYAFESDPRARLVREHLTELELAYVLHSNAPKSWFRWLASTIMGAKAFKFLDPNTNLELQDPLAVVEYLKSNYARN